MMRIRCGLWLLLCGASAGAQGIGTVAGHVFDAETHDPIMNANVQVMGLRVGDVTDAEGRYEIGPLPPGLFTLEATHIGYQFGRVTLQITGGELRHDFHLLARILEADEVVITSDRATEGATPVTFSNIPEVVLSRERTVTDAPLLLQNLVPGLYAYSDAGNGVGYTYLKVRGFDQKRVNVMINGIPLNDPEDHQVYWVDMPELTSSLQDVQVQRGVGTALFGQHGFGGSVNMMTATLPGEPGMDLTAGLGSWGTRRFSFKLSSGSNLDRSMYVRFSRILSDGYRERTSSDLWSYFFAGQTQHDNMTLRFNAFGGPVKTHAGWDAAHEDSLLENRRFNPVRYANEIDSFNQPHFELHFALQRAPDVRLSTSLFYIRGSGYYEQFKEDRELRYYGIVPVTDDSTLADLVRQKTVRKDHIGLIPRIDWERGWLDASVGAELSYYRGRHRGDIVWVDYGDSVYGSYYQYRGEKWSGSLFAHALTHVGGRVDLLTDLSIQAKQYSFRQQEMGNFAGDNLNRFEDSHTFFSPRLGITVRPPVSGLSAYTSVSLASREPADDDYFDIWEGPDDLDADPLFGVADTIRSGDGGVSHIEWSDPLIEPEELLDYEAGIRYSRGELNCGIAAYLMRFKNEVVPYGRFDDDRGEPVTGNAPRTDHRGIEFDFRLPPLHLPAGELYLQGIGSFSRNEFKEFRSHEDWSEEGEDLAGNSIPLFPDHLITTQLSYQVSALDIGGRYRRVGAQYLDTSENADRVVDGYGVIDTWIRFGPFGLGSGGRGSIEFRVENLADEEYETSGYYDSWEGASFFWVGAERTFYAGVELEL